MNFQPEQPVQQTDINRNNIRPPYPIASALSQRELLQTDQEILAIERIRNKNRTMRVAIDKLGGLIQLHNINPEEQDLDKSTEEISEKKQSSSEIKSHLEGLTQQAKSLTKPEVDLGELSLDLQIRLTSEEDIFKMNEILDKADSLLLQTKMFLLNSHSLSRQITNLHTEYIEAVLRESNFISIEQLEQRFYEVRHQIRIFEDRFFGKKRYKKDLELLYKEYEILSPLYTSCISKPVFPASYENAEIGQIYSFGENIIRNTIEKILVSYKDENSMYVNAINKNSVLDPEIISELNDAFFDSNVIPIIEQKKVFYTRNSMMKELEELSDPEKIQRLRLLIKQMFAHPTTNIHDLSDYESARELPISLLDIARYFFDSTGDKAYSDAIDFMKNISIYRSRNYFLKQQKSTLDYLRETLTNYDKFDPEWDNSLTDFFENLSAYNMLDSLEQTDIDAHAAKLDSRRLQLLVGNERVQQKFGTERINELDLLVAQGIRKKLFSTELSHDEYKKLGLKLLDFKDPETVPYVILTCFRDYLSTGENYFISLDGSLPSTDVKLYSYINSLTEETLNDTRLKYIPGVIEIIKIIKHKQPVSEQDIIYPQRTFFNPLNDGINTIGQGLLAMSKYYLRFEDQYLQGFTLDLLQNIPLDQEGYDLIMQTIAKTNSFHVLQKAYKTLEHQFLMHGNNTTLELIGRFLHDSQKNVQTIPDKFLVLLSLNNLIDKEDESKALAAYQGLYIEDTIMQVLNQSNNNELSNETWAKLLTLFVRSQVNPYFLSTDDIKDIFELNENKNYCLKKLREMWMTFLKDSEHKAMPFQAVIISKEIKESSAGPLKYIESLALFMYQTRQSFLSSHTTEQTKENIQSGILTLEQRFKDERWTEEDISFFYNISTDILHAAPSLYTDFLNIFNNPNFSQNDMRIFVQEYYPLFQTQLTIIQDEKFNQISQKSEISYDPHKLIHLRRILREFHQELLQTDAITDKEQRVNQRNNIFLTKKNDLIQSVQEGFNDRFGILCIPETFTPENVRTVQNFIRYIANIKNRTEGGKEILLSYFLALHLNDQWGKFRKGENIDITKFFSGERLHFLEQYESSRKQLNFLSAEALGIVPSEVEESSKEFESQRVLREFQEILQEETVDRITGNAQTIDVKLENISKNISELTDEDVYPEIEDRKLLQLLLRSGDSVGTTLRLTFEEISGKQPIFEETHRMIHQQLTETFHVEKWSPELVKSIQDRMQPLNLLSKTVHYISESKIPNHTAELHALLNPSKTVIKLFQKLGEEFKPTSGAYALSVDLDYLESTIVKKGNELNPAESKLLKEYVESIRTKMQEMETIAEKIKEYFRKIKSSTHKSTNERLKSRIEEIDSILNSKDTSTQILGTATSDFNLIIENMRQCLGCLNKEENNDTNLTFGDSNKFYLMSQLPNDSKSIADEIVFFVPVTYSETQKEISFVFDSIYGNKSSDILINHIAVIFKKYRKLKKHFPTAKISLFVSSKAMSSCSAEVLIKRLPEYVKDISSIEVIDAAEVDVPKSAGGDHYVEFGGTARESGKREISGIVIR